MNRRSRVASRPVFEQLDSRLVLSAVDAGVLQAAYSLNYVSANYKALNGSGETIAIIDAYNDPNAATELATFDAANGLSSASLSVDNLGSAGNTNTSWEEEEALDIEATHLAAPGARILLIEAKSDSTADLMAAVAVANNTAGVTVVSMSWGGSDSTSQLAYDNYFAHSGITYLAASGDDGAGAEWPSDSLNVVAVGGTSLVTDASGRVSESAWSDSGGGYSSVEPEPSYQAVAQATGDRSTPDVSADADPDSGLEIYSIANGGWNQVGGTSLSTPIWAGIIAVADQGLASVGVSSLSSLQTLKDLYYAPSGSFYDVTTGQGATTSYDTTTGLGTPNAPILVDSIIVDQYYGVVSGNGVGGDALPTTTVTSTGSGSSSGGGTTFPGYPYGGWGGFFISGSASDESWTSTSLPSTSLPSTYSLSFVAQSESTTFIPITPVLSPQGSTAADPTDVTDEAIHTLGSRYWD